MSKETSELNVAEQLEKFRQTTFKLAASFFVATAIFYYVIPTMFWVIIPLDYLGMTAYVITAVMALVFLLSIYRVNMPLTLIEKTTREYMKGKLVPLTEDEEKALAEVNKKTEAGTK